ncbi:MAG: hypothetical protein ACLS8N_00005, partial [Cutibacterium avidum]
NRSVINHHRVHDPGRRPTYAVVATLLALSTLFAVVKLRCRPAWLVTLILTLLALACLLSGFEWAYRALDLGAVAVMTVTAIFAALVGFIVSSPQVKAVRLDRALAVVALFVTAAVSMPTVSAVGRPQLVTINAWDYWPPQSATPITVEYEDPFTGRSAKAQAVGTQIQLSVPYPGPIPNLRITSPVEIDGNSYLMERRFQEESGPYFHWFNVRQQFFNIATLGSVRDASPTITVQLTKS